MPPHLPITQLWASLADLDRSGPPIEVLATKSQSSKRLALREAGGELWTYINSRYKGPLTASIQQVETGTYPTPLEARYTTDELPLEPLTSGAIVVLGEPTEAVSLAVRATESGLAPGLPVAWSHDAGYTWLPRDVGVLDSAGELDLGPDAAGLSVAFSGSVQAGAVTIVHARVEAPLGTHTAAVAAYRLTYNRGVPPDSPAGAVLKQLKDEAIAWARDVQSETAKLSEHRDASPGRRETRPRGGGTTNPWAWIDKYKW